jgi:dipeptide/tripeptide permease
MSNSPLLLRIDYVAGFLGLLLAGALLASAGPWYALSSAVGTVAGIINFIALRRIIAQLVQPGTEANSRRAAMTLLAKFALLGAAVYLLVVVLKLEPRSLAAGISTVVVALVIESLRRPDFLSAAAPASGAPAIERTHQ